MKTSHLVLSAAAALLLAACTHFRLFKGDRALQADLSYASAGSPRPFTSNVACNLRMATEMEGKKKREREGNDKYV